MMIKSLKKDNFLQIWGSRALIIIMDYAAAIFIVAAFYYLKPYPAKECLLISLPFLFLLLAFSLLFWLISVKPVYIRRGIPRKELLKKYALIHCSSLILLFFVPFYVAFPCHPVMTGYARPYLLFLWILAAVLLAIVLLARKESIRRWEGFLTDKSNIILLFIVIVFTLLTFGLALIKYLHFGGYYEDTTHFAQIFYRCTRGEFKTISIAGKNLLGIHFSPLLYLFVPVYYLFPYPPTLFFFRSLFLSLSIWPLYLILRSRFSRIFIFLFILAYLFFPSLAGLSIGEFHASEFAPFFIMFTFYFFIRKRFQPFLIFLLLSLGIKGGNIPLVLFFYSPYALLKKRSKKWVILPLLICAFWFLIATKLSPGQSWYRPFVTANIVNNLTSPKTLISYLIQGRGRELGLIYGYLHPLGFFLPWLAVESLFALPWLIAVWLMGGNPQMITWHYAITIPFAYIALARTLEKIKSALANDRILIAIIILLLFFSVSYVPIWLRPDQFRAKPQHEALKQVLKLIPSQARVVAPRNMVINLAHRKDIFTDLRFRKTNPGEEIDYIIFDSNRKEIYREQIKRGWKTPPFIIELFKLAPEHKDYRDFSLIWEKAGVYLYRNKNYQ